jgi:hypothetical protein
MIWRREEKGKWRRRIRIMRKRREEEKDEESNYDSWTQKPGFCCCVGRSMETADGDRVKNQASPSKSYCLINIS